MTPTDMGPLGCRTMRESQSQVNTGSESAIWSGTANDVMTTPLPLAIQDELQTLFGVSSITTLSEYVEEIRTHLEGDSIAVEDLCHASEPTGHRAKVGGDTYHFMCFYDAVVLAALRETAVDITTRSPEGGLIEATATGSDSLTVTPDTAVTSFGVASEAAHSDGYPPTVEDLYRAVCPNVKAFPDPAAYQDWAADHEASTVAIALDDAIGIASALLKGTAESNQHNEGSNQDSR